MLAAEALLAAAAGPKIPRSAGVASMLGPLLLNQEIEAVGRGSSEDEVTRDSLEKLLGST